jgi:hypothetical protein
MLAILLSSYPPPSSTHAFLAERREVLDSKLERRLDVVGLDELDELLLSQQEVHAVVLREEFGVHAGKLTAGLLDLPLEQQLLDAHAFLNRLQVHMGCNNTKSLTKVDTTSQRTGNEPQLSRLVAESRQKASATSR